MIPKTTATQQYVVQIANGPAADDSDRYAGRLLATIVGDDSGSRFFWEFVDSGLAECAAMTAYEFQGTGIFMTFLCCAPEETTDNLRRVQQILAEVEADGVSEAELTRAKSKVCSQVVLQSERPSNRLFSVGGNWIHRREYRTVRDAVESYRAVTCRELRELLAKYPLTSPTTVAVGPLGELEPPPAVT